MSERYVVLERQGYGLFGVVVDSTTNRDLCDADCCEAPEDASVHRHFAPLLDEMNALATRLTTAERELAEARVDLTNCADVGRRLEIELRRAVAEAAEADTTRREWEVRAAESWKVGRDVGRSTALADVTRAITELGVDVPTDALPLVMDIADMIAKADRESHATGREAGLREAAEMLDAERPGHSKGVLNVLGAMAARMRTCALAPPAAETPPAGVGHALSLGVCCAACYRDGKHSAPFRPMILCPKCGNKRCPRADSHANACTNSNEPGQVATPAAEPRDEGES